MKCGDCRFYYTRACPREPAVHKNKTCVYANSFKDYQCEKFKKKIDYRDVEKHSSLMALAKENDNLRTRAKQDLAIQSNMTSQINRLFEDNEKKDARIAQLEKGLEYYGDHGNYVSTEYGGAIKEANPGSTAREALSKKEKEE